MMFISLVKVLRLMIDQFLFGHLLISFSALSLTYYSMQVTETPPDLHFLLIIFVATFSVYSFHASYKETFSAVTSRNSWIEKNRKLLIYQAITGGIITVILVFTLPGLAPWLIPVGILTLAYSLPRLMGNSTWLSRRILYWKTIYLAMIWTFVTFILVAINYNVRWDLTLMTQAFVRFLAVFQVCILFELKDRSRNEPDSVRNMLFQLNEKRMAFVFYLISVLQGLGVLILTFADEDKKWVIIPLIVALFLMLAYKTTRSSTNDYLYYAGVDGILLIPGLLAWIL